MIRAKNLRNYDECPISRVQAEFRKEEPSGDLQGLTMITLVDV
jgi:hypothetical protein